MPLQSLGLRTGLIFDEVDGIISDIPGGLQVKTPSSPDYHWGNYLIFRETPTADCIDAWEQEFDAGFADQPGTNHRVFTWDGCGLTEPAIAEAVAAFEARGYEYDVSVVLTAAEVAPPPHVNEALRIRRLESDEDWQTMRNLQILCASEFFSPDDYAPIIDARVLAWRKLIDMGKGAWFGGFLEGELVGDAGLFWQDGIGRFQNVETHPERRQLGICGTLVHHVCRFGLADADIHTLVLEADEDYHAARIYESLGFRQHERVGSFGLYPE